jgi:23S rRNA pseudouridine1911/1915/1917 synthase
MLDPVQTRFTPIPLQSEGIRTYSYQNQDVPRSVLYEDDAVVVLDKPAGLLAVPIKGSDTPSALSLLVAKLKLKRQRALVVHRIDRFASGALLFAKTGPDRDALVRQFLAHTPVRQYLAVLRGRLGVEAGTLVHYFRREGMFQQLRTARDPQAARAELRYSVERLFADASLVRVELVTGLQNQIRAQFSAMGHPVIGDRKYHRAESSEPLIARVALHAAYLQFVHPHSGESVSIDCKLPPDFQHLVRELSRSSPEPVVLDEKERNSSRIQEGPGLLASDSE